MHHFHSRCLLKDLTPASILRQLSRKGQGFCTSASSVGLTNMQLEKVCWGSLNKQQIWEGVKRGPAFANEAIKSLRGGYQSHSVILFVRGGRRRNATGSETWTLVSAEGRHKPTNKHPKLTVELKGRVNGAFWPSATGRVFKGVIFSGICKTWFLSLTETLKEWGLKEDSQLCGSVLRRTSSSCSCWARVIWGFLRQPDHCS